MSSGIFGTVETVETVEKDAGFRLPATEMEPFSTEWQLLNRVDGSTVPLKYSCMFQQQFPFNRLLCGIGYRTSCLVWFWFECFWFTNVQTQRLLHHIDASHCSVTYSFRTTRLSAEKQFIISITSSTLSQARLIMKLPVEVISFSWSLFKRVAYVNCSVI